MWSILAVAATSAFSASTGMLFGPAALPLLICLMAMLISSIVSGPTLIGRSVGAASMLVVGRRIALDDVHCNALFFALKETLMIMGPWNSHPISALCARLDSINATPCVCGAFSSSWPEYNRSSPEASRCCPTCVQCVSLIPSISRLYLLISAAIWKALPVSHIVRTFHVPK
ncbi:unnamed protein product [Schistosoma curassoni]|uniref:Secreted protein n=1 Tax=Schistosoma curassoni TaxID=6186 RepID=A0A183KK37_9TREM|nr:unnamed protein product [Schistosoma curassoni]